MLRAAATDLILAIAVLSVAACSTEDGGSGGGQAGLGGAEGGTGGEGGEGGEGGVGGGGSLCGPEVCNGLDDDCDGDRDEDLGTRICTSGLCTWEPPVCADGEVVLCERRPTREICGNEIDDDCDENTDCLDADCSGIGEFYAAPTGALADRPRILRTGFGFAIGWSWLSGNGAPTAKYLHVSEDGELLSDITLSNERHVVDALRSGDETWIVLREGETALSVARIDNAGELVGEEEVSPPPEVVAGGYFFLMDAASRVDGGAVLLAAGQTASGIQYFVGWFTESGEQDGDWRRFERSSAPPFPTFHLLPTVEGVTVLEMRSQQPALLRFSTAGELSDPVPVTTGVGLFVDQFVRFPNGDFGVIGGIPSPAPGIDPRIRVVRGTLAGQVRTFEFPWADQETTLYLAAVGDDMTIVVCAGERVPASLLVVSPTFTSLSDPIELDFFCSAAYSVERRTGGAYQVLGRTRGLNYRDTSWCSTPN